MKRRKTDCFLVLLMGVCTLWCASCRSGEEGNEDPVPTDPVTPGESGCVRVPLQWTGNVLSVGDTPELLVALEQANREGDTTIQLEDGTYPLTEMLVIDGEGVTVRSRGGDREKVMLYGPGMSGSVTHIFNVTGSRFCAADLTLGRVANHAVQIHSSCDEPILHNLHVVDAGEQLVKVSYLPGSGESSEGGVMEWCLLEYTAGVGPRYYIGGIDAHQAHDWIVRHNTFRSIRSPDEDLAEHAVHFWSGSRGTLVEHNRIVDCDRGIGFGLGDRAHHQGIIRNNMIYVTRDVGIGLESCDGAEVYCNTVYCQNYPNALEYRFAASRDNLIADNLCNAAILSRDGGSATLSGNMTDALSAWFSDVSRGDLHLSSPSLPPVDAGRFLEGVTVDFDCQVRPKGSAPDVGADER